MTNTSSPVPWTWTPCEMEDGDPISGAQLVRADGKPVWTVDCGDYYGLSDEDAALIVSSVNAHAELRVQVEAASGFVRDVIEALGRPQPPLDAVVDLSSIAWQVVGQIEELKVENAELQAEIERLQSSFADLLVTARSTGARLTEAQARLDRLAETP